MTARQASRTRFARLRGRCAALLLAAAAASSQAAISYVGYTDLGSATQSTSMTLKAPNGITTGDVMVAALAQSGVVTFTPPSGWTLVKTSTGAVAQTLTVWTRTATAADTAGTSYVFTSTSSSDAFGGVQAWRGVDRTTPVAAVAIQANASGMTSVSPSVTPGVTNTVLIAMWGDGDASITMPNGMTATVGSPSGSKKGNTTLLSAYEVRAGAGATGTRTAALSDNVVSNGLQMALKTAPVYTVDHYQLVLPSTSLSCLPSTVTVTACSDTSSPCTNAATTIAGQTAALSTSGASLGATTLTFDATGIATTTLSYPGASDGTSVSVTLSGESAGATNARQCCPGGSSCSAANSCATTFNTAGFIVAAAANGAATTVPTQTAGTGSSTYYLRAVRSNTSTKACESALSGSQNVSWSYTCSNPTTCSSGNLMTLTGNAAVAIAGNPNAGGAASTAVAMTFDANGNAPFSLSYADVGQVKLSASKTVNSATLSGSSNLFVVKPAGFSVTGVQQTAAPNLANPGATGASSPKFVKAGESFSLSVTATTSAGAAAPNYGRETTPQGVVLTPALVAPIGGVAGSLSNSTIAGGSFSNGVASITNLAYSEVGIITLTPSVAGGSYLGAGAVSGTATGNIGRFVPANFGLSGGSVTHRAALACSPASAFSYLGENFSLAITLTARNVGGTTTANYTGSFAKLDLAVATNWGLAGIAGATSFTVGNGRLSLGSASGSWSAGVASGATLTVNAARAATPDGPFSASFGIAPADSDGVALAAYDLATTSGGSNDHALVTNVALRFGRLRLSSSIGAADRALSMPVALQYWNGTAFDLNTLDSCTTLPATALSFGNLRRTLTSADPAAASSVTVSGGAATLRLRAPGGGRSGTYDVSASLGSSAADASCLQPWTPAVGNAASAGANLAYLRGAWCGSTYDKDPAARASFGLQRTQDSILHRREMY